MVVGNSRQPQACVGSDETDFVNFFQVMIQLPMPDDHSRGRLLASFAAAHGVTWGAGQWPEWHAVSLAVHLTSGYTPGQLKRMVEEASEAMREDLLSACASEKRNSDALLQQTHHQPFPLGHSVQHAQRQFTLLDSLMKVCSTERPLHADDKKALMEWTARAQAMLQLTRNPRGTEVLENTKDGGHLKRKTAR